MVNTGYPSEACTLCRSRRVKCDATKPFCGNCFKLGKPCPGYPPPQGIVIRDDTDKTRKRAERIYHNLQNRSDDQEGQDSGSGESIAESNRAEPSSRGRSKSFKMRSISRSTEVSPEPSSTSQIIAGSIEALSKHVGKRGFAAYIDRISDALYLYPNARGPLKASIELLALSAFADSPAGAQFQVKFDTDRMRSNITKEMNSALDQLKAGSGSHEQILLAVEVTMLIDYHFNFRDLGSAETESSIRAHFGGMAAIVDHAGPALLETELGRSLYVNVFMCHLHAHSALTDLPPFPGPEDAVDILLQNHSAYIPEFRLLPLLQQSFNLRRKAMQVFEQHPASITLEVVTDIKLAADALRHDFEMLWARLPAAQKYFGSSMCRWAISSHWSQRILLEDTQIRCIRALQHLQGQPFVYTDEVALSIQNAQLAVRAVCQGLPYSFTAADLPAPEEETPTFHDFLFSWNNGHNPLLVCSMVDVLPEEQHVGIAYARAACARARGRRQPIVNLPRVLLRVN